MLTVNTHGAPVWVDLSTPDVEGATRFYAGLLGWDIERSETPMGPYYIGAVDGHEVAGMMQTPPEAEGMPSMWTTFINVDDVDQAAADIEAAGGTVAQSPFDIPDARIAVVVDPTGAMFGLFGGPMIEGVWLSRRVGAACWVETMTRDVAAAETFYGKVFGWSAVTEAIEDDRTYTTFFLDGEMAAGMLAMPDDLDAAIPAHWGVYFTVGDCTEAVERAVALGGTVVRPPEKLDVGHFAVLADPSGAVFQIMDFTT